MAIEYKRRVASSFQSITEEDINTEISGKELIVTTKIDGAFNLFYFDGSTSILVGSGGKVERNLKILKTVSDLLKRKGVNSLVAAVELHTGKDRSRAFNVMHALKTTPDLLTISAFDILEVDGESYKGDYRSRLIKLTELFDSYVVEYKTLAKIDLEGYFKQKVTIEGEEGLVIRSNDFPIVYKLKSQHSLDLGVIGYSTKGDRVRELLLAVMDKSGNFIQVGHVGNGLNEDTKKSLSELLSPEDIDSQYIEVDSRRVAFHMVKPSIVVEVSVNELLTENSKDIIKKPRISFSENNGFELIEMTPSASLIHPVIKRIRDDKSINQHDIRESQITDIVYIDESTTPNQALPVSNILFRAVYTKALKGKTNVKKFIVYKTNKDDVDKSYPAYVFHSSDFSPTRKDPLKKEIRISNSRKQIESICNAYIEKNIKTGWNIVEK